jgi:carbonic anhydrase
MPVIGTQQSPIRIVHDETIRVNLTGHLAFGYDRALPGRFKNDNFDFEFRLKPDGTEDTSGKALKAGGTIWVIRKIHIHSPAEHRIDDTDPAHFECHLVHSLPGDIKLRGPKLVVGVFFTVSKKPPRTARHRGTLYGLNQKLAGSPGDRTRRPHAVAHAHDIDPADFLPEEKTLGRFYRYEGSLTSEPFSEDVSWYVMEAEALVHEESMKEITVCAEQEARAVHALDRRFVLRSF